MKLINKTDNTFGQSTSFIENNKIAGNVSVFDKQYYRAINNVSITKDHSQQETLLHEEIHRYTSFIIGEYVKLDKFPGVEYYEKFKEYFNSLGIDVTREVEFLKEYFKLFKIYQHQKGWLNSAEFITYGLTNKGGVDFLKNITLHDNDLPERMKNLPSNKCITLYNALLNTFEYYYTNLSADTYASTTDTLKLKFDNVIVSPEQKQQAEKIYLEYLKTLPSESYVTKEGIISFIERINGSSNP